MNKFEGIQARGNAVEVCNPTTGHMVRSIAFCDSEETAKALVEAVRAMQKAEKK